MVRQIHRFRFEHPGGFIEEQVIWEVPRSPVQPEGYRYRLVYIHPDEETPRVLYDNHHPKGHHKHLGAEEFPYSFVSLGKLIEDFTKDVQKANENL